MSVTARVCCTMYAICCAAFTESARAVTASTRPPVATSLFSEFRDVPAWNTCRHPSNVRLHSSVQNPYNPYSTTPADVDLCHVSSHGAGLALKQGLWPAYLCIFDGIQIAYKGSFGVAAWVAFSSQHHMKVSAGHRRIVCDEALLLTRK